MGRWLIRWHSACGDSSDGGGDMVNSTKRLVDGRERRRNPSRRVAFSHHNDNRNFAMGFREPLPFTYPVLSAEECVKESAKAFTRQGNIVMDNRKHCNG